MEIDSLPNIIGCQTADPLFVTATTVSQIFFFCEILDTYVPSVLPEIKPVNFAGMLETSKTVKKNIFQLLSKTN